MGCNRIYKEGETCEVCGSPLILETIREEVSRMRNVNDLIEKAIELRNRGLRSGEIAGRA